MLIETVIKKLGAEFSTLQIIVDEEMRLIISPIHPEFGNIKIEENGDELIVIIGNFTWKNSVSLEALSL
jgi:hypothetical protein